MLLDFEESEGWTIVRPEGRAIECQSANELKAAMISLIRQDHRQIVLDLTSIEYVDSAGLGALVGCKRALGTTGRLRFANVSAPVRSVLELTGLHTIFELAGSIDDAIDDARGTRED